MQKTLLFLCFISTFQTKFSFDLYRDLKKDRVYFTTEHSDIPSEYQKIVQKLTPYSRLRLDNYKATKKVTGNNTVITWKIPSQKLTIHQIKTLIPGDTAYQESEVFIDRQTGKNSVIKGNTIHLKPHTLTFNTYVFKRVGAETLVYCSDTNLGLVEFRAGSRKFYPLYESVPLGYKIPDIDELMKTVTAN